MRISARSWFFTVVKNINYITLRYRELRRALLRLWLSCAIATLAWLRYRDFGLLRYRDFGLLRYRDLVSCAIATWLDALSRLDWLRYRDLTRCAIAT